MEVAILGGGISGLSCAYELRKRGIKPVVFEKYSHIGNGLGHSTVWPGLISRDIADPVGYLKEKFNLAVRPLDTMKEVVLLSPRKKFILRGKLGYVFRRGRGEDSLERQLAGLLDMAVSFDSYMDLNEIRGDFDKIIVATGEDSIPRQLHTWVDTYTAQVRVGAVLGNFNTSTVFLWLNTHFEKNTLCYLAPWNSKEASLIMVVNGATHQEMEYYWKKFLREERIDYPVIEIRDTQHYCGYSQPLEKEGVYFIGNGGGFTDDLIGTGAFNAILSGIHAADAIAEGKSYEELCRPVYEEVRKFSEIRKTEETLDNGEFDGLVSLLGLPVIERYVLDNPALKESDNPFEEKLYRNLSRQI